MIPASLTRAARHAIASIVIATGAEAGAATLSGVVTQGDGAPAGGALVTAMHADTGIEVSVFTAVDGHYRMALDRTGTHRVTAAWSRSAAGPVNVELAADGERTVDMPLAADPAYLDRVTSTQWLGLLPDGDMKREFILNCASCHEIETSRVLVDGRPRTREQWAAAFAMMRAIDQYEILPGDFDDAAYVAWLADHLDDDATAALSPPVPDDPDRLRNVRITEYPLPEPTELPHDLVVGPDGRIWITAFFTDVIWALDPASGAIETYALRPEDAEGWGQARALVFDASGTLWVILGGTHELVALDPETRKFETSPIGMYAHSLVLDAKGRVWFNDYFAERERIGVFDPEDEGRASSRHSERGPREGTGLAVAVRPPNRRTRGGCTARRWRRTRSSCTTRRPVSRHCCACRTTTWRRAGRRSAGVTGSGSRNGTPGSCPVSIRRARHSRAWKVGESGLGAYDAETDPRTGEIWITGALASSMVVYDPDDGSVLEIPLPTNPGYTRHLAVDPANGDLWSAYSSLPAATPKVRTHRAMNSNRATHVVPGKPPLSGPQGAVRD